MAASGARSVETRRAGFLVLACLAALACLTTLAAPAPARAAIGVESFSFSTLDDSGSAATQAGSHVDLNASIALEDPGEPETAKDLRIGLPPGLYLYPDAAPPCAAADFGAFECPSSTQLGLITARAEHEGDPGFLLGTAPVYLLTSGPGELLRLGFVLPTVNLPVAVPVTLRANGDYGLDLTISNLSQLVPMTSFDLDLWAVPADPAHDSQRFPAGSPGAPPGCPGAEGTGCIGGSVPVNVPEAPLTRNPTACTGPLAARLDANSWQDPGTFSTVASVGPGFTGCGILAFDPLQTAGLTTTETLTASGLDLRVQTTGETNPGGISWSDTKAISVALPPGLTIEEGAAGTQTACTLAEARLDMGGPVECPVDSEVGTFSVGVLGLADPLQGSIYFGGAESPEAHRLFLIASGSGIDVRHLALVEPDSGTGLETLTIADLPQFPFDDLQLSVAEEPGLFLTPAECGDYEIRGEIAPWSAPSAPFVVARQVSIESGPEGGPCIGPADDVVVALDPPSIVADGESVSTATATVADADADGNAIEGDEVAFLSSDPDQLIGPVTDNGDGTYTAEITASTTAGTVTVTAVDESVEPEVLGTAELTQTAAQTETEEPTDTGKTSPAPPAAAPSPDLPPIVTLRHRPPRRTHDRTPTFRFRSNDPGDTFSCRIDRRPTRRCTSPLTLARLGLGSHTFQVRAIDPGGNGSKPATYRFVVASVPSGRR